MSYYTDAIAGMPGLLLDIKDPRENFRKDRYAEAFQAYFQGHKATYEALENGYNAVIDKEQYIQNMAKALGDAASATLNEISRKGARQAKLLDYNLALAVYVYPAILEYKGNFSEPLTEAIRCVWKQNFPGTNVGISDYDTIQRGFKRKACYVTTAVCRELGKPDDCYELTLLRHYRDTYLMNLDGGEELVQEYYNLAPSIVKHIDQRSDRSEIYHTVWRKYVSPCISLIEEGKQEECKELYIEMVHDLQKKYFYKV